MNEKRKIVVLGEPKSGKTQLISKFVYDNFSEEEGMKFDRSYIEHQITLPSVEKINLNIQEVVADKIYASLIPATFQNAKGVILTIDLTNEESLSSMEYWLTMVKQMCPEDATVVIAGTKCDLEQKVTEKEINEMVGNANYPIVFCSNKTGENVKKVFETVCSKKEEKSVEPVEKKSKKSSIVVMILLVVVLAIVASVVVSK